MYKCFVILAKNIILKLHVSKPFLKNNGRPYKGYTYLIKRKSTGIVKTSKKY